ncbi:isochorismatase family protein [Gemmobacter serpentinus]|uniref:isochorismatase family protein n=1 Tax=Gemmobacter serpentinus TaxID=2652247 RepID=UPI00124BE760|nr:isochorismatase family protein [Gemmobacter serpentinus]
MGQALLIIDMQQEMQRRIDAGYDLVNPEAPAQIAALAARFRAQGRAVVHVRHRAQDPAAPFHVDAPGYAPMPCAEAEPGEAVFVKQTSSAFASTDLAAHLRGQGITDLVVTGAVAGFCVNSTVRAGADLGFRMIVVRDAVLGFGLPQDGLSARAIFDVTMGLLAADFAEMTESAAILSA